MGKLYRTTRPVQGDMQNVLLGKLLQRFGGQPHFGDSDVMILRRILQLLTGDPAPPDLDPPALIALILSQFSDCPDSSASGLVWGPDSTTLDSIDLSIQLGSGATTFLFPTLTTITNNAVIGNPDLTSISLPRLTSVGQVLDFSSCDDSLTTLELPLLATVGDELKLSFLVSLALASLPALTSVGAKFNLAQGPISTVAPLLTAITGALDFSTSDFTTSLSFPLLASIGGALTGDACLLLDEVSLPSLVSVGGDISLNNMAALATISLPSMTTCGNFSTLGSSLLTTVNVPAWLPTDGNTISCVACALTAASVNLILARCVAAGVTSCSIFLNGGTNAAPTGQGIVDKAALILAGNTVATN